MCKLNLHLSSLTPTAQCLKICLVLLLYQDIKGYTAYTDRSMLTTVPVGRRHIQLTLMTVVVSEANCETLGSMMENHHQSRFMNACPMNNDDRLQKELYVKVNGPRLCTLILSFK